MLVSLELILPHSPFSVLFHLALPLTLCLTCFFPFHTWTLYSAVCLLLLSPPHPLSPAAPSIIRPPSHLSLLPSLRLSFLPFSSGSPLIKPRCRLPPCAVSTHTSHTSRSGSLVSHHPRPYSSFCVFPLRLYCMQPSAHSSLISCCCASLFVL